MKKLFYKLSFRGKILASLLIFTIIFSGFSLYLLQTISNVNRASLTIKDKNVPELIWLSQMEQQLLIKQRMVNDAVEVNFCCNFMNSYKAYVTGNARTDNPPKELQPLHRELRLLDFLMINNVQGLLDFHNIQGAKQLVETEYKPTLEKLLKEIEAEKVAVTASLDAQSDEVTYTIIRSLLLLVVVTASAIFVAFFLSYKMSAGITRPVEQMIENVEDIANGQYGLHIQSFEQVELEQLTNSINQMSVKLKESFNTIMTDKIYREQILNSLPVGIITIDDEATTYSLNEAAKDILRISDIIDLSNEGKTAMNASFYDIVSSSNTCENVKIPFLIDGGCERKLLISQSHLFDYQHSVIGRIVYFIDITETEKLEKRMHHTEKLAFVGEMAAGAAHEIRNPLAVIHGFISLMNHSLPNNQKEQYQISLLLKELDRINFIVEQMLLQAKPGAPSLKEMFLKHVLDDVCPLLESDDVILSVNLEHHPLLIDSKQIKQVFHNLIRNSIEAMSGSGEISIYSQLNGDSYEIFINDNGPGIPLQQQSSIFDPFQTTKESGTGLGLTIVQRIIQNHGGFITLHESSELGTTFRISMPIYEEKQDNQEKSA
ncbi:HAMP domain-containing protein [Bacillus sp. HMF5848]|uniref:sensor histidine kinase n=1 Tax=Bacillus sp. HMF5848 TaxID=2495421 RepID=UPI000F76782D|nr:ATP-binding protein [Bacillus sp. HMF5848]RSK25964.1 HAMP domain-containing protein [Bacillus sp. HMF5848]